MTNDDLETLLLVQERDTVLDQLRHRRDTLPERAELDEHLAAIATETAARAEVTGRRDVLAAEERRLDDESQTAAAHAGEVDAKLYSGTVTSPRELQAMQADLVMLRRQVSEIEDKEIDIMEQREALDAEIAVIDDRLGALEAEAARLREVVGAAEEEIDAEIATEDARRGEMAESLPSRLVADYETRRARNKGSGAARLSGLNCGACHLAIPATEAERIRKLAGTEVAYCDNCSAILVP